MKGGGGDKLRGNGVPLLRRESQGHGLLSVAAGCFFFFFFFLVLSSRHDAIVLDTLGPRSSLRSPAAATTISDDLAAPATEDVAGEDKSLQTAAAVRTTSPRHEQPVRARASLRAPAAKTLQPAQGASQSHGLLQQSNADEAVTERVRDTAVVGVETNDVERQAEQTEEEPAAAATISDDQAAAPAAEDAAGQDKFSQTAIAGQLALQTTSPLHEQPADITTRSDSVDQPRQPLCDFSDHRTDVCDFAGDIRMDANASVFVVVVVDPAGGVDRSTYKVRPYPRKGDATSMGRVTEITVRTTTTTADAEAAPRCTRTHAAPAVVFSIGGYTGNLFHDFTDVIVPLYNTAGRYRGDVQLVVIDVVPWWLVKYGAVLRGLSRHPPLDLAVARAAGEVHCFGHAVVGLRAHGELIIDRDRSPDGLGMPDFTRFLQRALSLPRDAPTRPGGDGDVKKPRPRLLIISRRGTRLLLNTNAVVRAAEEVGFEAVVSGELYATATNDVVETGRLINSFDAVVGVHGAGLTNMVFLPPGAAMVQIVPWGGLRWVAQLDFGVPAVAMGLRYIQYEVTVDESTLKDKYPRDDVIFTNPTALHKKGFTFVRQTFLKDQDIIVEIGRFKAVLLQAFNSLAL